MTKLPSAPETSASEASQLSYSPVVQYPQLPRDNSFRLQQVDAIRRELQKECESYSKTRSRYKSAYNTFTFVTIGANGIGVTATGASVTTLAVGAVPISLPLGIVALSSGSVGLISSYIQKHLLRKVLKHERIKNTAMTKLGTINSVVSKALADENISQDEYNVIQREMQEYRRIKQEIRTSSRNTQQTTQDTTTLKNDVNRLYSQSR